MTLKKYLSQFSKEQLIEQVLELNKKYKDVKAYYQFSINPDISIEKQKAKNAVYECFFPMRGSKLRLKDARKIISDLKKLEPDAESLADVMMHYVESGVYFTNEYGDIDEPFYNSVAGMFGNAAKIIKENGLREVFIVRAKKIIDDTSDIGWGFHNELSDIYYDCFEK
ncbi:MAG: DUF6155 family protein [Ginsengibacter sp.]